MAQPGAFPAEDHEVEPMHTQQQDRVEVIRPAAVLEARAATQVLTALRGDDVSPAASGTRPPRSGSATTARGTASAARAATPG